MMNRSDIISTQGVTACRYDLADTGALESIDLSSVAASLSFFGPATVHSHFPEELGNAVEVHHYVVAAGAGGSGGAFGSLAGLRQQLQSALLCGTAAVK